MEVILFDILPGRNILMYQRFKGSSILRRKWQPTPVFLPRESYGQRSLVGCCPWVAQSRTWLGQLSMHACVGEGNGNPLQYSCLENPRDGGAWWAAIYGVAQSQTWLKWLSSSILRNALEKILSLDSVTVTSSYSLHPLIQDTAKFRPMVFKLWFGDPGVPTYWPPEKSKLFS